MEKEIRRFGDISIAKELGLSGLYIPGKGVNSEDPDFTAEQIGIQCESGEELAVFVISDDDEWQQHELFDGVSFDFQYMSNEANEGKGASFCCYEVYEFEDENGKRWCSTDLQKEYILPIIPQA